MTSFSSSCAQRGDFRSQMKGASDENEPLSTLYSPLAGQTNSTCGQRPQTSSTNASAVCEPQASLPSHTRSIGSPPQLSLVTQPQPSVSSSPGVQLAPAKPGANCQPHSRVRPVVGFAHSESGSTGGGGATVTGTSTVLFS